MKTMKLVAVFFLVLSIGIIPVPINAKNREKKAKVKTTEQIMKEAHKAIRHAFLDEEIKKFVDEDLHTSVFVTFRVDKNSQLQVVKIENADENLSNLIRSVVKEDKITLSECCKYRHFRTPLTFIYKE